MELDKLNVEFLWLKNQDKSEEEHEGGHIFLPDSKIYHNGYRSISTEIYELARRTKQIVQEQMCIYLINEAENQLSMWKTMSCFPTSHYT